MHTLIRIWGIGLGMVEGGFKTYLKFTLISTYPKPSGQCARLLLRRSKFEYRWCLKWKNGSKATKINGNGTEAGNCHFSQPPKDYAVINVASTEEIRTGNHYIPLCLFRNFSIPMSITISISTIQIEKSIDGVLGIQTQGHRMVGADKTTELVWPPPASCAFNWVSSEVIVLEPCKLSTYVPTWLITHVIILDNPPPIVSSLQFFILHYSTSSKCWR